MRTYNRKRKQLVQVYFDENELARLDAFVKETNARSRSDYIRKNIFGPIYYVDYSEIHKYNEALWRIQSSLNQIARRLNSTNNFYKEDFNEVKELMNEVWLTQESMLSLQPSGKQ